MRKIAKLLWQAYFNQKEIGLNETKKKFFELEKKLMKTFNKEQRDIYDEMDELSVQIEEEVQILAIEYVLTLLCPNEE